MRRAAALFSLAALSACFPDYTVVEKPQPDAPSAGNSGSGGGGGNGGGNGGGGGNSEPSCDDSKKNGDETGIDCGMQACGIGCPVGQGCTGDIDCLGVSCASGVCQAASCQDNLLNDAETDTDCGGDQGCDRCTPGDRCKLTSDCDGGECLNGQCQAPTCEDELTNGDETDMDCGGSCDARCGVGLSCTQTGDCDGVACSKGKCQPPACDDGLLNGDEGDQDCGGGCETKCSTNDSCKVGSDCSSGVCTAKKCAAPSCTDKVQNGKEPGIDCGIDCPTKCALGSGCNDINDCQAMLSCTDQHCVPDMASGKLLSPLGWIAEASSSLAGARPPRAIDGNPMTDFNSGAQQNVGMWFEIDMQKTQVAFSLELDCNYPSACDDPLPSLNDLPAAINVAFSDTNTDWANVEPVVSDHVVLAHDVITFPKPGVGRYMRITLSQGKNRWWRMDELRLRQ